MDFPVPNDEAQRLRILESYGILDTPPDPAFDRICALAARIFKVPIAFVSLIDRQRQYFKSCFGMPSEAMPREIAFCAHTILNPKQALIIEDAQADARFSRNPLVTGEPYIRFYVGMPILGQQGSALGSLCLIDRQPRQFSKQELETLRDLAGVVEDAVHLHERRKAARESGERYRALYENVDASLQRLRDSLLWIIPHELRTPLNGMLGFADLIRASWKELRPEQAEELIAGLFDAGLRLERSVDNVCLLTHLQIAHDDPVALERLRRCETQAIDSTIEATAKTAAAAADRSADLRMEIEPGEAGIPLNYVAKIVEELASNAFKFSEAGSAVNIRGLASGEDYLLIVADAGRGMSRSQLQQAQAFIQFDRELLEQQGLGLGLALVHHIARVYDLDLKLGSEPSGGLRATVRFPRHSQQP